MTPVPVLGAAGFISPGPPAGLSEIIDYPLLMMLRLSLLAVTDLAQAPIFAAFSAQPGRTVFAIQHRPRRSIG